MNEKNKIVRAAKKIIIKYKNMSSVFSSYGELCVKLFYLDFFLFTLIKLGERQLKDLAIHTLLFSTNWKKKIEKQDFFYVRPACGCAGTAGATTGC